METIKKLFAVIFDFLQGIVVILAIMVMIYLFIMSPQEISGASMEPNFHNGEYILTNKVIYRFRQPDRGEVIIFKSPSNKEIDFIKRIIGLPGDTVKLVDSVFYINGQPIAEPYLDSQIRTFGGRFLQENIEITVPPGQYFVAGDNRPHSADSREFGPIPKEDFIGLTFIRYWPFDRATIINKAAYNNLN